MATVTYRATKGAPLTSNELDANFLALNQNKVETSAVGVDVLSYYAHLDAFAQNFTLPASGGGAGKVLVDDGNGSLTFSALDALPSQTNNAGKYLTTDGTTAYWTDAISGTSGDVGGLINLGIDTQSYSVTSAQTTFSVTYSDGQVLVHVNGIKLDASEYTATSGTSITLSEALQAGDIIDLVGYTTEETGDLNTANWDTAYSWGDHSQAGYTTVNDTTDTVVSALNGSTPYTGYNKTNWDTAYNWGDHSQAGYITSSTFPTDLVSDSLVVANVLFNDYELTTNSLGTTSLIAFPVSDARTCKLLIQVTNTTDSTYYISELLCFHDNVDAYSTEYATMHTSAEPEIEVVPVIDNGNFVIRVTTLTSDTLNHRYALQTVGV